MAWVYRILTGIGYLLVAAVAAAVLAGFGFLFWHMSGAAWAYESAELDARAHARDIEMVADELGLDTAQICDVEDYLGGYVRDFATNEPLTAAEIEAADKRGFEVRSYDGWLDCGANYTFGPNAEARAEAARQEEAKRAETARRAAVRYVVEGDETVHVSNDGATYAIVLPTFEASRLMRDPQFEARAQDARFTVAVGSEDSTYTTLIFTPTEASAVPSENPLPSPEPWSVPADVWLEVTR